MALTAKLYADFGNFYDAVQKAEVSLKSFESESHKVEDQLNRMVDRFSGRKLVQDATLMAEAVERIGGVSKLTQDELARVSAKASEAAAKLRAVGEEVPASLQNLANHAKSAAASTTDWGRALSTATGYLSALGIDATISGVINFTKSVFDNASAIHDMGERLGISAEAVQGFKFAAEQAGSSLETVGSAITKMNQHLAEGDKATVAALKQAGLEFQNIRNLSPEKAFLAIADAIAEMPDPMEQSDVALQLFGKSAAELLPAIKEGFRQASDSASKMSTETIDALERAQDAWEKLGTQVTIITGTIIADTMDAASQSTSSLKNFTQFLLDAIKMGPGAALALQAMNEKLEKIQAGEFVGPLEQAAKAIGQTKEDAEAAAKAYDTWKKATDELALSGGGWQKTLLTMDGTVVAAIEHYLAAGVSQGTLAAAYGVTDSQVKAVDDSMKDAAKTQKEWDKLAKDQQAANLKGLKEVDDETRKRTASMNETVIAGLNQIQAAQAAAADAAAKATLSSTDYQLLKVKQAADAQIAAFKGTADQAKVYAEQVMGDADRLSKAIIAAASNALDVVAKKGMDAMALLDLAARQAKAGLAVDVVGNAQTAGLAGGVGMQTPIYATPMGLYGRAAGGPVSSGQPYLVGERGPELFVPKGNGSILPTGSGGVSIVVNVTHPLGTPAQIADVVGKSIMQNLRMQGTRLPSGA